MLANSGIRALIDGMGSATGGATTTQPQGGFNNSLDSVFSRTVPLSSPSSTGAKNPTSNSSSSTPVGAIVGGVLGGVAAILLAIGLFLYLRRRKARQTAALEKSELAQNDDQGTDPNGYKQNPGRHEVPGDFVQREDYKQNQGRQEVPGDFVHRQDYKRNPESHEVPGDFIQGDSAHARGEPGVHELADETRI